MGEYLKLTVDGPVANVTMARPDVHNAFSEHLIAQLHDAFRSLGEDDSVRVVVLTAKASPLAPARTSTGCGAPPRSARRRTVVTPLPQQPSGARWRSARSRSSHGCTGTPSAAARGLSPPRTSLSPQKMRCSASPKCAS